MELEQATLLKVTGEHRDGFRDRVIFAVALGTGLREHEIAALDVGDVLLDDGRVGRRIALRTFKRSSTEAATQEVFIPDSLWYKLRKLISWKRAHGESLKPAAPLFVSRRGRRISTRTLRYLFAVWQRRAGFDRAFNFHALRHTALTNLYRDAGHPLGAAARPAQECGYHHGVRQPERRGHPARGARAAVLNARRAPPPGHH